MKSLIKRSSLWVILCLAAAPAAAQTREAAGASASDAVVEFMRAASDSNLTRMAQLVGTDRGSSARTGNPDDFARRMVVMQAALAGITASAHGETATTEKDHMVVTTEIVRGHCRVIVPVTAVRAREGWLVRRFDLPSIWDGINRPCEATVSGNSNR